MLKKAVSEVATDGSTGGVAPGYVEDAFEVRTKLTDFFSIPLVERERNWSKAKHKHSERDPSDNDPPSAQRHLKIAYRWMSETPQACQEGPKPPSGPSDVPQYDEDWHHDKGHGPLA